VKSTERQSIPVVRDMDEASHLIELLDAAAELSSFFPGVVLFADADGLAEHVFRLWASARLIELVDKTTPYPEGFSIRSLEIEIAPASWIQLQWKPVALPVRVSPPVVDSQASEVSP
jgi:hypothetical protein